MLRLVLEYAAGPCFSPVMLKSKVTLPFLALLFLLSAASGLRSTEMGDAYGKITVPDCKTSIYIGRVTMHMSEFLRKGDAYEARYEARVFPFFFASEHGTLRIEVNADQLMRLKKGELVSFTGSASNSDGQTRKVEGTAKASALLEGTLKIKVYVSRSIKLSFPASYRFSSSTTTTSPSCK
jgi:hypothetical protein